MDILDEVEQFLPEEHKSAAQIYAENEEAEVKAMIATTERLNSLTDEELEEVREHYANYIADTDGNMQHTQWETQPIEKITRKQKISPTKKKAKRKKAKASRRQNRGK